jgi:N-acetylglutamate synthase-like GNAT family acetyltransferase
VSLEDLTLPIDVNAATPADLPSITSLLTDSKLPLDGLERPMSFFVARENGVVVGSAAIEEYPGGALIRSVAVADRTRGIGVGSLLTKAALAEAARRGHRAAYLLTTSAVGFFPRFGFVTIDRRDVPEDVRTSIEFTSACPSSALVMRVELDPP